MLNQCHLPIPIETTSAPASEHRKPGSMKGATHRWWKQGWFVHFRQQNARTEKNGSKKTAISFYRESLNAPSTWGELLVCLGMNWDHSWILNDSLEDTSIYREDSYAELLSLTLECWPNVTWTFPLEPERNGNHACIVTLSCGICSWQTLSISKGATQQHPPNMPFLMQWTCRNFALTPV